MTKKELLLETIAKEYLHMETLETRNSDRLDFHEVSVWCMKEAMERAYQAGYKAGKKKA